jgi:hypothetical protein
MAGLKSTFRFKCAGLSIDWTCLARTGDVHAKAARRHTTHDRVERGGHIWGPTFRTAPLTLSFAVILALLIRITSLAAQKLRELSYLEPSLHSLNWPLHVSLVWLSMADHILALKNQGFP